MAGPKGWLGQFEQFMMPEPGRAERRSVDDLVVYRWTSSALKQETVKNISDTGVYILTDERWRRGTLLSLILQREGSPGKNPERRIIVQAKVVRCGEDGVGLEFLREDPESRHWVSLRQNLIEQLKPEDSGSLVRMVEAVAFMSRICPGGAEELGRLVHERLSNHKVENVIELALKADSLLQFEPARDMLRADTRLVVRILEDGSCTDEDWLQNFWGGILATSCTVDGRDRSSMAFVELFSQLTTFPVRILTVVCTRAIKVESESGSMTAKPLACKIEEIALTTGSRGRQTERDLERLSELGLIVKSASDSLSLLPSDEIYITPSALALELFARCNGHRRFLRKFYENVARGGGRQVIGPPSAYDASAREQAEQ